VFHANAFAAEIVVAESNAAKVSNKLMEMFEQLADKPTKETYEQATAMVSMANSIVNVQMAQIKFYRLKKLWIISKINKTKCSLEWFQILIKECIKQRRVYLFSLIKT
jgi:5,10-methylenetetrahydrofolate reductase